MNTGPKPRRLNLPNWSLTTRLTLVMTFLVVMALAGVAFITTRTVQTTLTEQIGENLQLEAGSLRDQIEGFFLEKTSQIQTLSLIDVIKQSAEARNASYTGSPQEIQAEIDSMLSSAGESEESMRLALSTDNAKDSVRSSLLNRQVMQRLVEIVQGTAEESEVAKSAGPDTDDAAASELQEDTAGSEPPDPDATHEGAQPNAE